MTGCGVGAGNQADQGGCPLGELTFEEGLKKVTEMQNVLAEGVPWGRPEPGLEAADGEGQAHRKWLDLGLRPLTDRRTQWRGVAQCLLPGAAVRDRRTPSGSEIIDPYSLLSLRPESEIQVSAGPLSRDSRGRSSPLSSFGGAQASSACGHVPLQPLPLSS